MSEEPARDHVDDMALSAERSALSVGARGGSMVVAAWLVACGAAPSHVGADAPAQERIASAPAPSDALAKPEPPAAPTPSWREIGSDPSLVIEVAEALYRRAPGERWYLRMRMTNVSTEPIGVDLHDGSNGARVFRCESDDPAEPNFDWDGLLPRSEPLTESRTQEVLSRYASGSLISLALGASVDYYRPACVGMDELASAFERPRLTFWFDGAVDATDGRTVRRVHVVEFSKIELDAPHHFLPLADDALGAELLPNGPAKLDRAMIDAGLDPVREDARRCLSEHGVALGEQIRVDVVIEGASGRAVDIELGDRGRDSALEHCVQTHLRRAQFSTFASERQAFSVHLRRR